MSETENENARITIIEFDSLLGVGRGYTPFGAWPGNRYNYMILLMKLQHAPNGVWP
jgi:hypothetical protein